MINVYVMQKYPHKPSKNNRFLIAFQKQCKVKLAAQPETWFYTPQGMF